MLLGGGGAVVNSLEKKTHPVLFLQSRGPLGDPSCQILTNIPTSKLNPILLQSHSSPSPSSWHTGIQPTTHTHANTREALNLRHRSLTLWVSKFQIFDSERRPWIPRANSGRISNSDYTFLPYIDTFQDPIEVSRNRNWSYSNSIQ